MTQRNGRSKACMSAVLELLEPRVLLSGVPGISAMPGDLNADGRLDANDISILEGVLAGGGRAIAGADVNDDGILDSNDLLRLQDFMSAGTSLPSIPQVETYVVMNDGWDGPGQGSASLKYWFESYSADLTQAEQRGPIISALNEWATYANITWTEAQGPDENNSIDFSFASNDGQGGTLAFAYYPPPNNPEPQAGDISFDDDDTWTVDGSGTDLFSVALHELGHSLGLAHSTDSNAVMYAYYRGQVTGLAQDDISGIQSIYSAAGTNHRPELTNPTISPLSGSAADTYTFTVHYYDEDHDPPAIYNGRQYSELCLPSDRVETMHLVSGTPANGTYQVALNNLSSGIYWHFFSFADSRGMSAMTPVWSGPYVSVAQGSDLSSRARWWKDPVPDGDNDEIPEIGERLGLNIYLKNDGGQGITDVAGYLTASLSSVEITDRNDNYGDIPAGQERWGGNDYHMFVDMPAPATVTFTLHVTYRKGGVPYYQDLTFTEDFHRVDNNVGVHHVVGYDPPPNNNDGDGVIESGEFPEFDLYLTNLSGNGSIFAKNVRARVVSVSAGQVHDGWFEYPDLQGGGATPQKQLYGRFSFSGDGIPTNYAGPVTADIEIMHDGLSSPIFINDYLLFNAEPDPWMRVEPGQYNFGLVQTTQGVDVIVTVRNNGSDPLQVTAITPSHLGDTTIVGDTLPWTIPAGPTGFKAFHVIIETSALRGQIERTVTVTSSNAHIGGPDDNHIHIYGMVSDLAPATVHQVPGANPVEYDDIGQNIVVWAENRTGDSDIFAYDFAKGQEYTICNAGGDQYDPFIGGNVIAWADHRSGAVADIYSWHFPTGDLASGHEDIVSVDPALERMGGVDSGKVAYTRLYYDAHPPYLAGPSNLYLYDAATGLTTQVTNFSWSGSSGGNVEWGNCDFGGGMITWLQDVYALPNDLSSPRVMKYQVGSDPSPVEIASGFWLDQGPVTNGAKVAWTREDVDGRPQVWIWDGGAPWQLTFGAPRKTDKLAIGGHADDTIVAYGKSGTGGVLYAWDMQTSQEFLVTDMSVMLGSARMDGHAIVWSGRVGVEWDLYYAFLKQADIAVSAADLSFDPLTPVEGSTVDVMVTVHNDNHWGTSGDIRVRLYDRDPDLPGAVQLGPDGVISGGLAARASASVPFPGIVIPVCWEPSHEIWAKVFPTGDDNPGNNKAHRTLTVLDSDTVGPIIGPVIVAEYNGDGDGIIGADEQIQISWDLSDPSGIASTQLLVDGNPVTPVYGLSSGNPINAYCYAILGPLGAGPHTYAITATDADAPSPASSLYTGGFAVVPPEEITILYDGAPLTDGQTTPIDFGTVFQTAPGVNRIFFVQNDGQQALSLGAISVPTGFTVTAPASSVLAPGDSTYFTVTLQTGAIGTFGGSDPNDPTKAVFLVNSDGPRSPDGLDENPFNFPVSGIVRERIPGDADLDGQVEFGDYQTLESHFGTGSGMTWSEGDFDGDGDVDFADYQALEANYGGASGPLQAGAGADTTVRAAGVAQGPIARSEVSSATTGTEPTAETLDILADAPALLTGWPVRRTPSRPNGSGWAVRVAREYGSPHPVPPSVVSGRPAAGEGAQTPDGRTRVRVRRVEAMGSGRLAWVPGSEDFAHLLAGPSLGAPLSA